MQPYFVTQESPGYHILSKHTNTILFIIHSNINNLKNTVPLTPLSPIKCFDNSLRITVIWLENNIFTKIIIK